MLLLYLHSGSFRSTVELRLESWLTQQTGRETSLRLKSFRPLTLQALITEASIAGSEPGAAFVEMDRLRVDLKVLPLFAGRLAVSELEVDTLSVDLTQAPPAASSPSPGTSTTLAEWLDRVAIDEGRLTGGRVRAADASWPVEIDARGIGWTVQRDPTSSAYRIDLEVKQGTARLPNAEWFSVGLAAGAELDPAGLQVDDFRLTTPGAEIRGQATLEDLQPATGSIDAHGNLDLEALPWPQSLPPADRGSGRLDAEVSARLRGADVTLEGRLASSRLTFGNVSAENLDLTLTGADGKWESAFELGVFGAEVRGSLRGQLTPGFVPLEGNLSWSAAEVNALASLLGGPPDRFHGRLDGSMTLQTDALKPEALDGRFTIDAANLGSKESSGLAIASRVEGAFSSGVLELTSITARGAGLKLQGRGRADMETRTELEFELERSESAGKAVTGLRAILKAAGLAPDLPAGAISLNGDLRVAAQLRGAGLRQLDVANCSGDLSITSRGLTAAGQDGLPLDAAIDVSLADGSATLRKAELRAPGVQMNVEGVLKTASVDASLILDARDGTGLRLLSEAAALGLTQAVPASWIARIGDARIEAQIAGSWTAPSGHASIELAAKSARVGDDPRALTADARLANGELDATLRLDGGSSFLDADVHADRFDRWPMPGSARFELVEASPDFWFTPADASPSLSGTLTARGVVDLEALQVRATVGIADGSLSGRDFELDAAELTIVPDRFEVADARLRLLGGQARIDGVLGGTAAGGGLRIQAESLELEDLLRAAGYETTVAGALHLDATLTGTLTAPQVAATVETRGLAFDEQLLADLTGAVNYDGSVLRFDLAGTSGTDVRIAGAMRLENLPSWNVEIRYPLRLDTGQLGTAGDGEPLDFAARLVGELRGTGADTSTIEGRIEFQEARLASGGDTFVPRDAPVIDLRDGRAHLLPNRVEVAGVALDIQGSIALSPEADLSLSLDGKLPLRSLSSQIAGARMDGIAELALRITGTPALPLWSGEVRVKDGRLDHRDLPAPFTAVQAAVSVTPDSWSVEQLQFRLGGGLVNGSGTYRPATVAVPSDLQFEFQGRDVRLPAIEGLRSQFDADLRLSGTPAETLTLGGRLTFDRAVYSTDIDLQRELLAKVRIVDSIEEVGGALDRLRLDLQVEAPGTLFVRNNLASLQTSASLLIRGTAADPLATGRIELDEGGRVTFRNVTYSVVRGTLDYTSDRPDNPRLDIEGSTSVRDYDVTLLISGKLENPQIDLISAPPLSQADIVSLLVTGRTRDDLTASGAGMSEAQAALYLGSGITREVERTLARSLGLDQVTLDPTLVAAEDDPVARLTVGKALTGKLSASYSRAFGGARGDIYQLRYEPFDRLSFRAQQNDTPEFLADAVYERKLYIGPQRADPVGSESATGDRVEQISFEGMRSVNPRRLSRAFGLRKGDRFRRSVLLDGLEAIRGLYLERGFPEADIDVEVDDEGASVAVVVTVKEGRRVDLQIDGKMHDMLHREVMELWQQSVFRDEIAEDAKTHALELLSNRGYVAATVHSSLTSTSDDQVTLKLDVDAGPRVRIERVVLQGNQAIDRDTLRLQLLSLGDSPLRRDWLRPSLLAEDREAVRSLYSSRGYLEAKVQEPKISYPDGPERAQIDILIQEGPRYELGAISFSGNAAYDDAKLREIAGLVEGEPYVDDKIRAARGRLRDFYDKHGFAGTQISVTRTPQPSHAKGDLLFTIEESPFAVIESIDIENPGLTRTRVITNKLTFKPGDPLSADELAAARQELYRTGLFRSVTLVDRPGETTAGRRLELKLDERANVRAQAGLGYGTDQGPRGSVALSHLNLGGERLYGSVGALASRTDWRVYGLLRQPNLFGSRLQGLASSSVEQENGESFDVRRRSTSVQIEPERAGTQRRWFVGYGLEEADIYRDGVEVDPASGQVTNLDELIDLRSDSTVRLANLNFGVTRGSRDDFTWPTRGNVLTAKFSIFDSAVLSEADFTHALAQWSFYRPVGSGLTWSAGLRLGVAEPHGGEDAIPLSERFFIGGDSTLRGFRRDSIVPVGFPAQQFADAGVTVTGSLGGEAMLIFNQELIIPFFDPVALVAFHDAGQIYWQRSDFDPSDLRHAAGLGVRVRTPVGPLRLEYGWKLDRQPAEDRGRFHFSVGIPF